MTLILAGGVIAIVAGVIIWLLWGQQRYTASVVRQRDDSRAVNRELTAQLTACRTSRDTAGRQAKQYAAALAAERERYEALANRSWELARRHGNDVLRRKLNEAINAARAQGED